MAPPSTTTTAATAKLALSLLLLVGALAAAVAQNCGCAPSECCSRFGFCGNSAEHCGPGCRSGPCNRNNVQVADLVTAQFFDGIANQSPASCPGKGFYSRDVFLRALEFYPGFARVGSEEDSRREVAAFFAHATHETGHFCAIEEDGGPTKDYCQEDNTQYPCNPSKGYYGRGALQLSWNYNYGPAGADIGFDGLNSPETVATDPEASFRASLWYWMNSLQQAMATGGFGATTRAINGDLECNGRDAGTVQRRAEFYTEYCRQLGVAPGENLTC